MIKNNPVRCAAEGCAFYAVVLGGFCEEHEVEAYADFDAQAQWVDANFDRITGEWQAHYWDTVD